MKKILIVEDDIDNLGSAEFILHGAGHTVVKVNRQISIKEIAGINPDLIIIDYLLSFGLGSDLCLELKRDKLTEHMPVILYSVSNSVGQLAKDSSVDAQSIKAFDIDELVNLVDRLVLQSLNAKPKPGVSEQ